MMEMYTQDPKQHAQRQRVLERIASALEHQAYTGMYLAYKQTGKEEPFPVQAIRHKYHCAICCGVES